MNGLLAVARKEARLILRSRQLMISALFVTVVFSGTAAPAVLGSGTQGSTSIDAMLFMVLTVTGIFMGYLFSGQVFLREKTGGTIETLLCTPLSLREIWAGKVAGVTFPAYLLTLVGACIITGAASAIRGEVVLPSAPAALHVLVVVPAFIAVVVGLLGFAQLLLGMRENQIINMVILFCVIFSFSLSASLAGEGFVVSWGTEGAAFAVAAALLLVVGWATRFLNRERIVTTIP
ncbi:MAG: type transport system permease protein [Methanofollis sp.]|nr:type transport system permease protein [Methanofollis sp.]